MISKFVIAAAFATSFAIADGQAKGVETGAIAGEYKTDSEHRYITFSYVHQGYSVPFLRWRTWDATLDWNPENPEASSVDVVIDASSIDSGVDRFDGHLRGERFFDVENHPTITFTSTSLTQIDETTGTMTGDLTVKDITKPVTLDVTFNKGEFEERNKRYKLGFSARGTVKRSDFGVDTFASAASDDVDLLIETEFLKPVEE